MPDGSTFSRKPGAPFIVYGMPRSRTFWISRFMSYGKYQCAHDQLPYLRSLDDAKSWLSQDWTGTAETAAAPWWRLAQHFRPDLRVLVVRRPVADVMESLLSLDMRGICAISPDLLAVELGRINRRLDRIERQPGVLSVRFDDLDQEDVCGAAFEHCTGYAHDPDWWRSFSEINLQRDVPAQMRYHLAHRRQLASFANAAKVQFRMVLGVDWSLRNKAVLDQVTIAEETFDATYADAPALKAQHYAEAGERYGGVAELNVPLYRRLAAVGALQVMTARAQGRLVGYLVTVISPSLEDARIKSAWQNVFFTKPEFRGVGTRLQKASVDRLRERGVTEVVFRAGVRGAGPRLGALYQRLGAKDFGHLYNLMLKEI